MAGRFLLSQLHQRSSLEIIAGALALFWMSQASFRSGWNGFPRHTSANENLVSSDVVYHESEKWASALGLQRVLGLGSYRTAWLMLHKLRQAMVRPGREKLSGVLEVDETYSVESSAYPEDLLTDPMGACARLVLRTQLCRAKDPRRDRRDPDSPTRFPQGLWISLRPFPPDGSSPDLNSDFPILKVSPKKQWKFPA